MLEDPPNQSTASAKVNVQYLKEGATIVVLPVPDEVLRLVGLVAVHWGTFEVELDKLMAALFSATGQAGPIGWERFGFAKRKKLFVEIVRNHLESNLPAIAASYRKIAGDAADLHWRRNLVVHGLYRVTFPPAGNESPFFWAEGTHNGKEITLPIDVPTLEKLWHGIAHLTGGLIATARLHGERQGWPETFSDTEILRIYREANHPWNSNPDKRTPLP